MNIVNTSGVSGPAIDFSSLKKPSFVNIKGELLNPDWTSTGIVITDTNNQTDFSQLKKVVLTDPFGNPA